MGNATWACFACRVAVRRLAYQTGEVPCPRCGLPCRGLGTKIRIPDRDNPRAWLDLLAELRKARLAALEHGQPARARKRHDLERQIAHLEQHRSNPGRRRLARLLRKQLAALMM